MQEKLINLANAALEVHKSSADHKEAIKNFRAIVQIAHDIGAGINTDPVVGVPKNPKPTQSKAGFGTKHVAGKTPAIAAGKLPPKKPVAPQEPTPATAAKAVEDF
jgi:hypothetical protein